jgi:hypothetical protein
MTDTCSSTHPTSSLSTREQDFQPIHALLSHKILDLMALLTGSSSGGSAELDSLERA